MKKITKWGKSDHPTRSTSLLWWNTDSVYSWYPFFKVKTFLIHIVIAIFECIIHSYETLSYISKLVIHSTQDKLPLQLQYQRRIRVASLNTNLEKTLCYRQKHDRLPKSRIKVDNLQLVMPLDTFMKDTQIGSLDDEFTVCWLGLKEYNQKRLNDGKIRELHWNAT